MPEWGEGVERLRRATVTIETGAAGREGRGSGVMRSSEGEIVTNAHVVAGNPPVRIELWNGRVLPASIEALDRQRDLAALKVEATGLPAAEFRDSGEVRAGEWVMAIGTPWGFAGAMTRGVVHGLGPLPTLDWQDWIQADIRLAPGNSGGPLASADGRVIGINTMVAGGLALAVPSNDVLRFFEHPEETEEPPQLGVVLQPVQLRAPQRLGLRILHIEAGSPAENASLAAGDILIGADGDGFRSPWDLRRKLQESRGLLRVTFLRGPQTAERKTTVCLSREAV